MFCGRGGEFVSFELLRHGWARVLVAAGIRTYKLHSSRHTAGLIVLAATGDIRAVSRVAATNVRHSAKPEKLCLHSVLRIRRTFEARWGVVFRSVKWVVDWGLAHRDLNGVGAIGIDEIAVWKGHKYLTIVYQIDEGARRMLWVGRDRTE